MLDNTYRFTFFDGKIKIVPGSMENLKNMYEFHDQYDGLVEIAVLSTKPGNTDDPKIILKKMEGTATSYFNCVDFLTAVSFP